MSFFSILNQKPTVYNMATSEENFLFCFLNLAVYKFGVILFSGDLGLGQKCLNLDYNR